MAYLAGGAGGISLKLTESNGFGFDVATAGAATGLGVSRDLSLDDMKSSTLSIG